MLYKGMVKFPDTYKSLGFYQKTVKKNYVCCMCDKRKPLSDEIQIRAKMQIKAETPEKKPYEFSKMLGRVCSDKCFKAFLLIQPKLMEDV